MEESGVVAGSTRGRAARTRALALLAGVALLLSLGARLALAGPPGLYLTPTHGVATASFSATYQADPAGCAYTFVRFMWDGSVVGTPPIDATCGATLSFKSAPTATIGAHGVTGEGCTGPPVDPTCTGKELYTATYTVDSPPPTLTLKPTKGLVAHTITATYFTPCAGYTYATFYWARKALPKTVPFGPTCTVQLTFAPPAGSTPGKYAVSAEPCQATFCDIKLGKSRTYTVLAPPPTPPPTPTPTQTPTIGATPSTSPSLSPSVEPLVPSAEPTVSPTPAPTGEVEAATGAPRPSPSAVTAIVLPSDTPSRPAGPQHNDFVSSLAASVKGPEALAFSSDVLLTNVLITVVFVFMFGLTSEIFNSTMDANRAEIEGWWTRLIRGPLRFLRPILRADSMLDRLSASGPAGVALHALVVLTLVGVIYGFLSPDFGFNQKSLILFISLVIGLGFVTYFMEGTTSLLAIRRHKANASVQLYGTAVLVAIVSVIASRFINFSPGLVYGFIASSLIMAPVALAKRDEAFLVLLPAIGLLVISLVAWVLLQPARTAAGDGSWLAALLDTILAMIVVAGLEGLFFTMIPLRFMDGAVIMRWSRLAWALVFGTVTFLWWQLLLNQNGAYAAAFQQTSVQLVVGVLLTFMITTGGIWTFFRFHTRMEEVPA